MSKNKVLKDLTPEQKRIRGGRRIAKWLIERAEERGEPNPFQVLLDRKAVEKKLAAEKKKRENDLWEEFVRKNEWIKQYHVKKE
ncbi:MAG: hypothetical protein KOO66_10000 [Bacteroidales bacterium]|nr:hypothetical protein [Bacteroidales bacterium]